MATETATITLPTFLENALIHGDLRGLGDTGLQVYASVVDHLAEAGWYVTDVARDGSGGTRNFRLQFGPAGSLDVTDYVIHRPHQMESAFLLSAH
jgi:hypothetical protein